mmetsp:Transcript_10037/g.40715  ORF Transcript_10037/g.40715 Transcript_10037/m.40715 type:complete len:401 (+) Transcript_10037:178-1380(+)
MSVRCAPGYRGRCRGFFDDAVGGGASAAAVSPSAAEAARRSERSSAGAPRRGLDASSTAADLRPPTLELVDPGSNSGCEPGSGVVSVSVYCSVTDGVPSGEFDGARRVEVPPSSEVGTSPGEVPGIWSSSPPVLPRGSCASENEARGAGAGAASSSPSSARGELRYSAKLEAPTGGSRAPTSAGGASSKGCGRCDRVSCSDTVRASPTGVSGPDGEFSRSSSSSSSSSTGSASSSKSSTSSSSSSKKSASSSKPPRLTRTRQPVGSTSTRTSRGSTSRGTSNSMSNVSRCCWKRAPVAASMPLNWTTGAGVSLSRNAPHHSTKSVAGPVFSSVTSRAGPSTGSSANSHLDLGTDTDPARGPRTPVNSRRGKMMSSANSSCDTTIDTSFALGGRPGSGIVT